MIINKTKSVLLALAISLTQVGIAQQQILSKRMSPVPVQVGAVDKPSFSLNGTWNFRVETGQASQIAVPGEWEMQGFSVAPGEKAVYERNFDIPENWKGSRVVIKFDAVSSYALVKVNGQTIGSHEGGFVAFEMDITDAIRSGQNQLTVEVRANTISDILSCTSQYAAHTVGGILRKVTVFALPQQNIADLNVATDFDAKFEHATLNLGAVLTNQSAVGADLVLRYTLKDKAGKLVFQKKTSKKNIQAQGQATIDYAVKVNKPNAWTAETPYLYELTTELLSGSTVLQTTKQKVGFREIEVKGNELLVNGRPVKLKGVNRHAVHPLLGRASKPELDRQDAELFLSGNLNYIRTSHYPASEEFLEAADELGLYVESESALNWIMHHASPIWRHWDYQDKKYLPTMLAANIDNVMSYKKHPSVIFWSLGNESRWSDLWVEVNKVVKGLDKTRPTSFHDQTWGGFNNAGSKADIANYHYPGITGPAATDTMSRPTLFGEYAHLSTYNRRELLTDPGVREAFNAGMVTFFDSIYVHKGNLGGAIWSGIDDTFHLPDGRIVGYGPWGPVDGWRREKPEFYGMKKAYSPVKIFNPRPTDKGIALTVANRYDFRSLADVIFNVKVDGQSIPVKSAVAARSEGVLIIPGVKNYRRLEISAFDSRGFEIDREIFEERVATVYPTALKALTLTQDSAFIYVQQGDVHYTISKTYGLMTSVRKNGAQVLTKGPSVAVIAANKEDGGKPNVAGETYQNNIYPIKHYEQYTLFATAVEATDTRDSIIVDVELMYQNGTGKQRFVFDNKGLLKTSYEMIYDQADLPVYQYGLMMELPLSYAQLNWDRKGTFSYYPADHIGRNQGEALLGANELYEVESHGKPLAKAWKDEPNTLGTNDFRSTKANIYTASLRNDAGAAVQVFSNAAHASRTWKQDEHIQWLVADYTNNGSEPFYGSPHSNGRLTLKKGDVIKGGMTLFIQ